MSNILTKISSKSIRSYIECNLDDFYTKSSNHSNFNSFIDEKIRWVKSNKADWPDCIFRANFENVDVEEEVRKTKSLILEGKIPNGWTIGPLSTPLNLGNVLKSNGFKDVYYQAGMAFDLNNLKTDRREMSNLILKKVDTEDALKDWLEVISKVFKIKVDYDLLKYLLTQEEVHFYLGNFNEETVSALLLYLSSGVAGLHAVSTLPEYRNNGFGLSISKSALKKAYKMGFRVGVLQASSLGESVYRKLGFKKYCDIISYSL